jgi:hypothetical protein
MTLDANQAAANRWRRRKARRQPQAPKPGLASASVPALREFRHPYPTPAKSAMISPSSPPMHSEDMPHERTNPRGTPGTLGRTETPDGSPATPKRSHPAPTQCPGAGASASASARSSCSLRCAQRQGVDAGDLRRRLQRTHHARPILCPMPGPLTGDNPRHPCYHPSHTHGPFRPELIEFLLLSVQGGKHLSSLAH